MASREWKTALLLCAWAWMGCRQVVSDDEDGPGLEPEVQALLTAEENRYFDELAKVHRGEAADLDGDGVREITAYRPDAGTLIWEVDTDEDGWPELVVTQTDGVLKKELDEDADGHPEWVETTTDSPAQRVVEENLSGSWALETRTTSVLDVTNLVYHVTVETDPSENGKSWQVQSTSDTPVYANDGAGVDCKAVAGFPARSGTMVGTPQTFRVLTGTGGRCNKDQTAKILKAMKCASDRNNDCMAKTNHKLSLEIATQFDGKGDKPLYISCSNPCPDVWSTTTVMRKSWETLDSVMAVSPSAFTELSDAELCSMLLHESMHWAGEEGGADHDDQRSDRVWACGRYCGGCQDAGPHFGGSGQMTDCLTCAGTTAEKATCGTMRERVHIACPAGSVSVLCHGGLGQNSRCASCEGIATETCDGRPVTPPPLDCCQDCPDNFPKNDIPCAGRSPIEDKCPEKPPLCQSP